MSGSPNSLLLDATTAPPRSAVIVVAGGAADAWIIVVRPSRRPRCGLLRMTFFLNAITNLRHPEEARSAVSKDAKMLMRTVLQFCCRRITRGTSEAPETCRAVAGT